VCCSVCCSVCRRSKCVAGVLGVCCTCVAVCYGMPTRTLATRWWDEYNELGVMVCLQGRKPREGGTNTTKLVGSKSPGLKSLILHLWVCILHSQHAASPWMPCPHAFNPECLRVQISLFKANGMLAYSKSHWALGPTYSKLRPRHSLYQAKPNT